MTDGTKATDYSASEYLDNVIGVKEFCFDNTDLNDDTAFNKLVGYIDELHKRAEELHKDYGLSLIGNGVYNVKIVSELRALNECIHLSQFLTPFHAVHRFEYVSYLKNKIVRAATMLTLPFQQIEPMGGPKENSCDQ